jgi:DNA invertase Pin-like site-specific DNA recombinase
MKYGYARISNLDDHDYLNCQLTKLREFGCSDQHIFVDHRTGVSGHRPALNALQAAVKHGDEVAVWTLDRIGRSISNVTLLVSELAAKGASLRTLGEGSENLDTSNTSNTQHCIVFTLLERFRSSIDHERSISNGSRRPRGKNRVAGYALNWTQLEYAQEVLRTRRITVKQLCDELQVSAPTVYAYIDPTGELRERGHQVMKARTAISLPIEAEKTEPVAS